MTCRIFSHQQKLAFFFSSHCRGRTVIPKFSVQANRQRCYHPRQLSEKQINFFTPSSSIVCTQHDGQLLTIRMHNFIGVDVSCQSNIRRMQNRHWKWWGNPHAYIYQLIKGQSEGDADFFPLYTGDAFSLKFLLFSHERLLYFLSSMPRLHLPYFLSFSWALSFLDAQLGRVEGEHLLLGRPTTERLHRSSWRINCFIHSLLNKLFIQEVLSFRATLFQTLFWLTLFRTPLHPLLRKEDFKCWKCRTFYKLA